MSAAHVAVMEQVPVPLVMVTVALELIGDPVTLPTEHTPGFPLTLMAGMVLAFVVAETTNVEL